MWLRTIWRGPLVEVWPLTPEGIFRTLPPDLMNASMWAFKSSRLWTAASFFALAAVRVRVRVLAGAPLAVFAAFAVFAALDALDGLALPVAFAVLDTLAGLALVAVLAVFDADALDADTLDEDALDEDTLAGLALAAVLGLAAVLAAFLAGVRAVVRLEVRAVARLAVRLEARPVVRPAARLADRPVLLAAADLAGLAFLSLLFLLPLPPLLSLLCFPSFLPNTLALKMLSMVTTRAVKNPHYTQNPPPPASPPAGLMEGFILSRQWLETDKGLELIYWLASEQGPLKFHLVNTESVCFIPAAAVARLPALLPSLPPSVPSSAPHETGWRSAPTALRSFDQEPVAALYCRSHRFMLDCRDRLRRAGVAVFESDIKPTDRFLMERFITGAMKFTGRGRKVGAFSEVVPSKVEPGEYRPALRSLSIDIETDYGMEHLYSIALYAPDFAVVVMQGEAETVTATSVSTSTLASTSTSVSASTSASTSTSPPGYRLLYAEDERAVLKTFLRLLHEYDPDALIGWNVVNFDLLMLQKFCDRAGLPFTVGRDRQTANWRRSRESAERHYVLIPGRAVLDGIELMRTATYSFEDFSLEYVSRRLLGRGKLVEDVEQRGEEISRLFETDKPALADYNLEDCRLVWDIFEKEKLWDFAIERASLTGLELDRYGGSVAAFDYLYLPRLHRKGYVAPDPGQLETDAMSPGGYVLASVPGIHEDVVVLDFKSLYPSIIRTFQVDPLGLVHGLAEDDAIEGFDGGRFSRSEAILPRLIETLWRARDRAKAQGNAALSQAIKIIMNSFYGVLGTRGCRFFDPRLVSSITRRGHEIILATQKEIERRGHRVIYGDTDSVFVILSDSVRVDLRADSGKDIGSSTSAAAAVRAAAECLAADLNDWWRQRIEEQHRIPCHLELQFETHFHKFLMPTVRGADTGSKKRYAGTVTAADGEECKLLFKGLETVRSDWSQLARDFQQSLYERIFSERPYEDYIKQTVQDLRGGKFESELLLRKRLRRRLKDYVKNIPPHVQAARKVEERRRQRGLSPLYSGGGGKWVEYYMTVNGPEPRAHRRSAMDYDFYIERQLAPIADSILVFKSTSMGEILNTQMGLF